MCACEFFLSEGKKNADSQCYLIYWLSVSWLCLQPGSSTSLCWVTQHGHAANDFAHGSNNSGISGHVPCVLRIPFS